MHCRKLLWVFFLLLLCAIVKAQSHSDLYFTNYYSTNNGLSNNAVICITQDYKGFIWVGTQDGLNRFDGKSFKIYRNIPGDSTSISSNYINCIFQDKDSVLWIGTRGKGLCRYNRKTDSFTSYLFSEKDTNSISHHEVFCFFQDQDGILWIGTDGGGLNRFNRETGNFTRYTRLLPKAGGLSSLKILSISGYTSNYLLLGTWDGGLNYFNKQTGLCTQIMQNRNSSNWLSSNNVWTVRNDGNNNYWIGYFGSGLQYYNTKKQTFTNIEFPVKNTSITVYSIITDNMNRLWAVTNVGIFVAKVEIRNNDLNILKPFEKFNSFPSIYAMIDKTGSIWTANLDNGLLQISPRNSRFVNHFLSSPSPSIDPSNIFVKSFCEDQKGNIFIATTQGAYKHNPISAQTQYADDLIKGQPQFRRMSFIATDAKNNLWAARSFDLAKYNWQTNMFEPYFKLPKAISPSERDGYYDILPEGDKTLWLATENGFYRLSVESKQIEVIVYPNMTHNGFNIYQTRSIEADSSNLYIGTLGGGLLVLSRKTKQVTVFQNDIHDHSSISSNHINQVFISSDKKIWLATFNGLERFIPQSGKFEHYSTKDGLPVGLLNSITEDDHKNLWISSNNGISKFNTDTRKISNYFFYEQYQSSFQVKSVYKSKDGRLYFGRRSNFISFYPDSVKDNTVPPQILITDFKLNNQSVKVSKNSVLKQNIDETSELRLNYNQSSFTISFAAMNFVLPERNNYAYKLEPFDKDWIFSGNNNTANYTNVPPGDYIFRVKGSNQDGVWNDQGIELKVIITPPFWKTLAFRIVMLIIILSAPISFYFWKTHKIRRENALLEDLIKKRTMELSEANSILEEQKEELLQNKEELEFQKESLEETNVLLEEKKIEIERHIDTLEETVDQRTSELKIAKEKAEESDRLKSAFLANMSHEIRTPLNAIVGFSSLLDNEDLEKEKRENFVDIIKNNSNSLLVLIDDILILSRIEAGQLEIRPTVFPVFEVFNELFEVFNQYKENPQVTLSIGEQCLKEQLLIHTDQIRFKQILINLLSNAFKFTEKGFVEMGYITNNETEVTFYVKDSGIGIEKEFQEAVFDRFRKIESNSDKLYGGTGLGLAICRKLTDALHGRIWVESEPLKGSVFYFTLPKK